MNRTTNRAAARLLRLPMLIAFLVSGLLLDAQGTAPQPPAKQPLPPAQPQKPLDVEDPAPDKEEALPSLRFIIRSAFSLTPPMVKAIQAKSGDAQAPGAAKGAAGGEGTPEVSWGEPLARTLPFSAPLDVSLAGKNVLALIRIVPVELRAAIVELIVQGQVWVKMPDNSLSFKTMVQTLSVALGSRLYFYPLGVDAKTGAPIAVEIRVDRQPKP
ncbi:hypothetical protein LWX53_05285 [bacterium]|nr:hypothetical protein [bacterium]